MEFVRDRSGREVAVRTLAEARSEGLALTYWKDAVCPCWVVTDDSYVVGCIKVREFQEKRGWSASRTKRIVATTIGTKWVGRSNELFWTAEREKFLLPVAERWQEADARRTQTRIMARVCAMMLLANRKDHHLLGLVHRGDQALPSADAKRILKQEEVRQLVSRELAVLVQRKGVSAEYVIGKMKKAIDLAESKQDAGAILRASGEFREMLGMNEQGGESHSRAAPAIGVPSDEAV
jgi:hypothetical protein